MAGRRDSEARRAFVERYGGIYEHSPWVAECAWQKLGGDERVPADRLRATLRACVDEAGDAQKLALIRAHPDLAGRAAVRGELTRASSGEQASAGLDQCTPAEFARFQSLNSSYRGKFGFPFVMAVRGSSRDAILAAFEARLTNDEATELERAIAEIHAIARLRLDALAGEQP